MKRQTKQRGNSLIEFAASLVLLAVMFAGIFEIGYSLYAYSTLVTAVRAGARFAAMQPRGSGGDSGAAAIAPSTAKVIRNFVVYGDPAPSTSAKPVVAGLSPDHVELINSPDSSTVSLRGFEIDALFMKFKLDGRPAATFPVTTASLPAAREAAPTGVAE